MPVVCALVPVPALIVQTNKRRTLPARVCQACRAMGPSTTDSTVAHHWMLTRPVMAQHDRWDPNGECLGGIRGFRNWELVKAGFVILTAAVLLFLKIPLDLDGTPIKPVSLPSILHLGRPRHVALLCKANPANGAR